MLNPFLLKEPRVGVTSYTEACRHRIKMAFGFGDLEVTVTFERVVSVEWWGGPINFGALLAPSKNLT